MPHGIPRGAMCVQRFDDSLNSAIHTTYRISLRSSSMPEPRDPLLKVLIRLLYSSDDTAHFKKGFDWVHRRANPPRKQKGTHSQGFPRFGLAGALTVSRGIDSLSAKRLPGKESPQAWSFVLPPVSPSHFLDGRFHPLRAPGTFGAD